jgi:VanZ family protein
MPCATVERRSLQECEVRSLNRYWVLIAILLAAVVFSPDPGSSRAIAAAHDFAHAPVFGCVSVLLLVWLRGFRPTRDHRLITQYAVAIAGGAGLGLATEIAQAFAGRDASWVDLRSDVLGSIAFAAMFALIDARIDRRSLSRTLCALGVILMIVHSLPFVQTLLAYVRRNQEFPTLFEARDSTPDAFIGRLRSEFAYEPLPPLFATTQNEQALHIRFTNGPWLGMYVDEPRPDWSGYQTLAVDLTNPSDAPLHMVIRVHDRAHNYRFEDRFNRAFRVPAATRMTLLIPLAEIESAPDGRKLDLCEIAQIILFTAERNAGRDLYVSRIWLQ